MASSRPRLLRTAAWVAGAALLLLGVWARQHHTETYFENSDRSAPSTRPVPVLVGRGVPDAPAPTGEAPAKPGETWFDEAHLAELMADDEPEFIVGRVFDAAGHPLEGMTVMLALDDDGPPDPDTAGSGVSTDEQGYFVFTGLPDRTFRLTAERPRTVRRDWRTARPTSRTPIGWVERVVVEGVRAGRKDVRIRMPVLPDADAEWKARIRAVGPDGKDVPAWGYTECSNGSAWSSIEGKVEPEPGQPGVVFFVGRPPFGLIVESPATKAWEPLPFAPGFIYPIEPREEPYVVHLKRAEAVRGHVDLQEAAGGARVLVRYAILTSGRAEDPERITSDVAEAGAFVSDEVAVEDDGSFVFDSLPPGRVRLIAAHGNVSSELIGSSAGQTVTVGEAHVRLRLPAHAPIRGRIDWQAVEGAKDLSVQVHVSRLERGRERVFWSKHLSAVEVVQANGRFETPPLLTAEEYTVEVWASGQAGPTGSPAGALAWRRVERVRPGGAPLFMLLAAAPGLRGRVEQVGGSPAGADVDVRAVRLSSDALRLAASLAGDDSDEWEYFTQPEPGVLPAPGDGPHYATTDAKGEFDFPGLRPGRYIVWTAGAVPQYAVAGAGGIRLVVGSAQRITGRVRAGGGATLRGFIVEARHAEDGGAVLGRTIVRADGYFELRGVPEGAYGLIAYNAGDPSDERMAFCRPVPSGTRRLDVRLGVGRQIKGIVRDERGVSTEGARVEVGSPWDQRRVRVARDGTFRVGGLVEVSYSVRIVLPDGRQMKIGAAAGGSVECHFR